MTLAVMLHLKISRLFDTGKVLRIIFGKSIVMYLNRDLLLVGGNVQICRGQKNTIGHALHALRRRFLEQENTEYRSGSKITSQFCI